MKVRVGIPKGSLQEATLALFAQCRTENPHQLAFLFCLDRRPGNRVHADPRAGDGPLRRARRSGLLD